jgi:lysophospholipase L1-like esterase
LAVTLRRARAHVLIIGLPDLSVLPAVRKTGIGGVHAIVTSWNAGMAKVARQTGCRFLDLADFTKILKAHPEYISGDGLHPANAGYRALAKVVLTAIRKDRLWPGK